MCVTAAQQPETGPAPALDKAVGGLLGPALELPHGHLSQVRGWGGRLAPGSRPGLTIISSSHSEHSLGSPKPSWHLLSTYCALSPLHPVTHFALTQPCQVGIMIHKQETEAQSHEDECSRPTAGKDRAGTLPRFCGTLGGPMDTV